MLPFHSPLRPTVASGAPGYPSSNPKAALPALQVYPTERGGWRVSLWLVVEARMAQEFTRYAPRPEDFLALCTSYSLDPEGTMEREFGWPGVEGHERTLDVSLDDLDL